jgi:hydrogenase/urease accessory protein HupE
MIEMSMPSIAIGAGFLAGALHVFAGADHLGAMVPLALEEGRPAWRIGLLWAAGHTATTGLLGLLLVLGRHALPQLSRAVPESRAAGWLLLAVGAWGLARGYRRLRRRATQVVTPPPEAFRSHLDHASLGLGLFHGIFGCTHLALLFPVLAIGARGAAFAYVAGFVAGSAIAMVVACALLGAAALRLAERVPRLQEAILGACSLGLALLAIWMIAEGGA